MTLKKETTLLLSEFRIAETDTFKKTIRKKEYKNIYKKIQVYVYPQLQKNPYFGRNIRKLKGDLKNLYRFRVGDYRLFYLIDEDKKILYIADLHHRKDAYR